MKPYIFIIGFNKCGTRSFHEFFLKNGFKSIHWDEGNLATSIVNNCQKNIKVLNGYDKKYQVFSDMIYLDHQILIEGNVFFREMDHDYPNSYFIYNTRDIDNWIDSRLAHNGKEHSFLERYKSGYKINSVSEVIKEWKKTRLDFEKELYIYFYNRNNLAIVDIDQDKNPSQKISTLLNEDLDPQAWGHFGKTDL